MNYWLKELKEAKYIAKTSRIVLCKEDGGIISIPSKPLSYVVKYSFDVEGFDIVGFNIVDKSGLVIHNKSFNSIIQAKVGDILSIDLKKLKVGKWHLDQILAE